MLSQDAEQIDPCYAAPRPNSSGRGAFNSALLVLGCPGVGYRGLGRSQHCTVIGSNPSQSAELQCLDNFSVNSSLY